MTPTTQDLRSEKFYNLSLEERLKRLAEQSDLTAEELDALAGRPGLTPEQANPMVENVVGIYALPLGIAQNFVVNGRAVLVPMVIEEPSVIAGASFMARLAQSGGGFFARADPPECVNVGRTAAVGQGRSGLKPRHVPTSVHLLGLLDHLQGRTRHGTVARGPGYGRPVSSPTGREQVCWRRRHLPPRCSRRRTPEIRPRSRR